MKHGKRILTKRAMMHMAIRIKPSQLDLLRTAAKCEEISQSDFLRKAIEDRARRILLGTETERAHGAAERSEIEG